MAPPTAQNADVFQHHRGRLFGIAFGVVGSGADAEDIVQDVYLRWAAVDVATVDSPGAYLTTITTRLAIDKLRSAQHRRETYVGPWLPEPLVATYSEDPAQIVAEAEQLSLAMLTALERLNPVERAVLLLREVFDLDYSEIADVVDKSPSNCRQIAVRARNHVGDTDRPPQNDPAVEEHLLAQYMEAIASGDVTALAHIFAEDVVLWSDGGGKTRAARHLLNGAERVAKHLIGVNRQTPTDIEVVVVRANAEPGFLGKVDGRPIGLVTFSIVDGLITGVHALLNPDKLNRIRWP